MLAHKKPIPDPMKKVSIVSRKDIPVHLIERNGNLDDSGELRIFHSNAILQNTLQPSSEFSLAWATLKAGEIIPAHTHDTLTILIVYQGSGQLLLEDKREFSAGDCIVIPPYCESGFIGGTPDGFHAISIEVGKDKNLSS
jgi:quercetin dioxygenase-like cupin family protein